jgi:hypothetical protein
MRAANAANAQKSTGPKTVAGKQKSSMNAVTHAMTCDKLLFLPGESTEKFDAEVAQWVRDLGAKTAPEIAQVKTAVYCLWKAERADKADVCAVNGAVHKIEDAFDDAQAADAKALEVVPNLASQPKETVARLMSSRAGCAFLIGQFGLLEQRLSTHCSFEVSQRSYALQLGGRDPKDLFRDPVVMELNRNYLGGIHGPGFFTAEMAAQVFMDDRPEGMTNNEFQRRLGMLVDDLPSIHDGRARLQEYVQERIVTLTERLELMEFREKRDRATAIGEAESDVTAAGDRRQRYAATSRHISHAALRMLITLKHERRKFGEGEQEGANEETSPAAETAPRELNHEEPPAAPTPATAAEAPQASPKPAVTSRGKNEPVATQAVDGVGINNASTALSEQDHEAIQAHYRQSLAKLEAHLKLGGPPAEEVHHGEHRDHGEKVGDESENGTKIRSHPRFPVTG